MDFCHTPIQMQQSIRDVKRRIITVIMTKIHSEENFYTADKAIMRQDEAFHL